MSDEFDSTGYKFMFEAAVIALADIDKLLGLPEDGCNDPQVTVSALADFIAGHKEMQKSRDEWIDAQYSAAALEADRAGRWVASTFTSSELAAWLEKEMPDGTVIGKSSWWADRIARQVHYLMLKDVRS